MATKMPVGPALTDAQLAEVISLLHAGAVADARDGGFGGTPVESLA